MIACIFSGQGSQKEGMGQDLCLSSGAAAKIYEDAKRQLGIDLLALTSEELAQTRYAQISIVVMSLAAYAALQEKKAFKPAAMAGFSLGEYSALGASGVLSQNDLLDLVQERARLMQEASDKTPGVMYAVLGLDDQPLMDVVNRPEYAGKVFAVNFNCPGQVVIAGFESECAACAEALQAAGARKIRQLNVSGAFHTVLMQDAAERLAAFARSLTFNPPSCPLYSNANGQMIPDDVDWPDYLAAHMCSPVRWTSEIQNLEQAGIRTFIELGPGKVLTGLVKKIATDAVAMPGENQAMLDKVAQAL